ncbi:MAG TPA: ABC transporter substrate-binding protein [Candidatus Sulfomarinibacteraceae bacterium]|nr:ABC transporter substrate-binding protein [Candidatus Sulfomarinibacteraceae bacterium]
MRNVIILLLALLFVSGCAREAQAPVQEPEELVPIQLPMAYIPDPQFAPFYVAVERGYFADAGFEVAFDYSFETDGIALVGAGELPFAIVSGEQVILARAQQLPVVYVMAWYQDFPVSVVSLEDAGIETPADLEGRTVGIPGLFGASYVGYVGLLSAAGVDADAVEVEEIGFTQLEALLNDRADAVVGYTNNEPVQLRQQGEAINVLDVSDYIDLVANGVISNESTIEENPEMVQRFVGAILRGLRDTLADPEAAFEISKGYVEELDDSRMVVLEASLPLWEAEQLGATELTHWQQTEQILLEAGLLDEEVPNLEAAFTNRFVEQAQP